MEKTEKKEIKQKKDKNQKNNSLDINYNEVFLSYELDNNSNDKKNSYKRNKSLIFI